MLVKKTRNSFQIYNDNIRTYILYTVNLGHKDFRMTDQGCETRDQRERRSNKIRRFGRGKHHIESWYGHIMWLDEGYKVKQTMKMEVRVAQAKGKPRTR